MGRRPRAAAQAAAASIRTPTPLIADASDEEVVDVPEEGASSAVEEEDLGTPAQNSEPVSEPSTPAPIQPIIPRKRRAGRPPKNRPADWDNIDETANEPGSEVGTPIKRRRGRPPTGGGRWKQKGGPSHVTQVPIDKEGNMMDVIDDEVALPEDPEGETKVDKMGHLLGGREYRVRTFTILGRGERLYMLSTEPARCIGFRDSYLFFQKHKQLYKIIIDEAAKRDLIEREIIPHSYKGRAIGVVTARSVFREFGARIIIGGKRVIDDYQAAAARANGEVEGELADPNDKLPAPGEQYDRNRYVAWHGASSVYHTGVPSIPITNGKILDTKKRKVIVTGHNWMFEHAQEASRFNTTLLAGRRQTLDGVYDPHTNLMHYPAMMQPTHARWEPIPPSLADGDSHEHDNFSQEINGTEHLVNGTGAPKASVKHMAGQHSIFTPVSPVHSRNYLITDTYFESPPISGLGLPGPDGDCADLDPKSLLDVDEDVWRELPSDCLEAFMKARQEQLNWKTTWDTEHKDGARSKLRIHY
ncbi:hypothetical protein L228DRAFT_270991 [Xylona heveae TC161]|uniref:Nuclear localization protein n=1 Tax=Xylona heveae (strain CBS 132557 / TC161) TaxID=1328760 RepID=A0A164ZXN9_XYLHT|nr:hypothetical protein L228DRAFT_270991 [Xylona heveae TC161]KZF19669.1 hypothetical protein L228DRAFT_270991 [Xylona heveae TC161]